MPRGPPTSSGDRNSAGDADPILGTEDTALSSGDEAPELANTELPTSTEGGGGDPGKVRYRALDVGATLGRLELTELLGEGGMATVFRARDTALRRDVAVKVLFPHLARRDEVVKRFHREARAAAGLDHPNILRVLDVGGGPETRDDAGMCDPPYMVLELIEGDSLRELTRSEDRGLVAEAAAAIGAVLCRALAVAHDRGIIHRDIKPANVMIDGGRLVLADFGVAQVSGEDSIVTRTGALLGTPAFMSPEQANAAELDPRSDLYSVGATLYQLATGTMPFTGSTAKVVASIVRGEYVAPLRREPKIGPAMAAVIDRLMSVEPDDRFATAAETEAALLEIAGTDEPDAVIAALLDDPEATRRRLESRAITTSLEAAERSRAHGRLPRAIAWADRVLALDPDNDAALVLIDQLSGRGARLPLIAGLGALVLAGGAAVAYSLGAFDDDHKPIASNDVDAAVAIDAMVAELDAGPLAPVMIDAAPKPAIDARRGEPDRNPAVRPQRDAAAPRPIPDAAPRRPVDAAVVKLPEPPGKGDLVVKFPRIACKPLSIDGQSKGAFRSKATFKGLTVGPHRVRCNHDFGAPIERTATVIAGKTQTVTLSVRVTVTIGTAHPVRINGRIYTNGQSFRVTPGRVGFQIRPGSEWKRGSIGVRGNCTLKGPPYVCR